MSTSNMNQTSLSSTPDAYDPHIIPAETAARKVREGDGYKHTPENPENGDSIDTAGGYTVDQEGIINNYASEPEMYIETVGDLHEVGNDSSSSDKYTNIDTLTSPAGTEKIELQMKEAGIALHKISIIGKDFQDTIHVRGSLNWQEIDQPRGFVGVLEKLGISPEEALQHDIAINAGKFIILVTGSDSDINHTYKILHKIGQRFNQTKEA